MFAICEHMVVNVISKPRLLKWIKKHPRAERELLAWYKLARTREWHNLADVREDFPSADLVGRALIFNIRHNDLRLISFESFRSQRIFVKALLTHKEYDRREWMKWA
jgi:mRNA interferase HigB